MRSFWYIQVLSFQCVRSSEGIFGDLHDSLMKSCAHEYAASSVSRGAHRSIFFPADIDSVHGHL